MPKVNAPQAVWLYQHRTRKPVSAYAIGAATVSGHTKVSFRKGKITIYEDVPTYLLFPSKDDLEVALIEGVQVFVARQRDGKRTRTFRAEVGGTHEVLSARYFIDAQAYRIDGEETMLAAGECRYGMRVRATYAEAVEYLRGSLKEALKKCNDDLADAEKRADTATSEVAQAIKTLASFNEKYGKPRGAKK